MIGFIYTKIDNFPRSSVGWRAIYQSVGSGSNLAPVLLFISFVELYICIFGANVIDSESF